MRLIGVFVVVARVQKLRRRFGIENKSRPLNRQSFPVRVSPRRRFKRDSLFLLSALSPRVCRSRVRTSVRL